MVIAMRIRALLTAALLAAGVLAAPAGAATPTLAGTTVVSGNGVGAMRVRLPRDVTLSLRQTDDLTQGVQATFRGRGRLLTLLLVSERDDSQTYLMRSAICMTKGCTGRNVFMGVTLDGAGQFGSFDETRLRAGTYTLYWIADGQPGSVTVRLTGLPGKATLRPPRLVHGQQWGPRETVSLDEPTTGLGVRAYGGETEAPVPVAGRMLGVSWVRGSLMHGVTTVCLVDLDSAVPGPPVSGFCPPGARGWSSTSISSCLTCFVTELILPSGEWIAGTYAFIPVPKGDYELGAYAHYAGRFGATSLAVAVLPGL